LLVIFQGVKVIMKKIINAIQQLKEIDGEIPQIRDEIKQHFSLLEEYSKNILKQYESEAVSVLNQYVSDLVDFSTVEIENWKTNAIKRLESDLEVLRISAIKNSGNAEDQVLKIIFGEKPSEY